MPLYQPNFSDGNDEVLAPFLVQADNIASAYTHAANWFFKQDDIVQEYFVPLLGDVYIKDMIERKPNQDGVLIIP